MYKYEVIPPSPSLQGIVRYFWTLEVNLNEGQSLSLKSYVDDTCGIAFQIDQNETGVIWKQSPVPVGIVYGLTTGFHPLSIISSCKVFGVVLNCRALFALFRFHAADFTDNIVKLEDVLDKHLTEQINEAVNTASRISVMEAFLLKRRLAIAEAEDSLPSICQYIFSNKGMLGIGDIEKKFHIHCRQLERKFQRQVGVSPSHYIRVARFREILDLLQDKNFPKLTEIAYELDFSDQSHFIKQVKSFSGHTPGQLKKYGKQRVVNTIICAPDRTLLV